VNVLFFVLWYALDIQGYVKTKLESYISTVLKGSLEIEKLSINDRHLTINGISLSAGNNLVSGNIRQIQIDYNLLKLFTSGFSLHKIINNINIYNPDLVVSYTVKPTSGKKKTIIPDLTPFFDYLSIKQGKLRLNITLHPGITAGDTLVYKERFRDVSLEIINKKQSELVFQTITANSGSVKIKARLDKGTFSLIDIAVEGYKPNSIVYNEVIKPNTEISALFTYSNSSQSPTPKYRLNTIIWNTEAQYKNYSVLIPLIQAEGDEKALHFVVSESKVNENSINLRGDLYDILEKPRIDGVADITRFNLNELDPILDGTVTAEANIVGPLTDITAHLDISSDYINVTKERFNNIDISADYKDKNLKFTTDPFQWRSHSIAIEGSFNLDDMQIKADIQTTPDRYDDFVNVDSRLSTEINLKKGLDLDLELQRLDFYNNTATILGLSGNASLDLTKQLSDYPYFEFDLYNNTNIELSGVGNLELSDFSASLRISDFSLQDHFKYAEYNNIRSLLSGEVNARLKGLNLSGTTDLSIRTSSPKAYQGKLLTDFEYSLSDRKGNLVLSTSDATAEQQPFFLTANLSVSRDSVNIHELNLDNVLRVKSDLDLKKLNESTAQITIDSLDVAKYWSMFSPLKQAAPITSIISSKIEFNNALHEVNGYIDLKGVQVKGLKPFEANFLLSGDPSKLSIDAEVRVSETESLTVSSDVMINQAPQIIARSKFNDFPLESVIPVEILKGKVSGSASWSASFLKDKMLKHELLCDITSREISYGDFVFDNIRIKARQNKDQLIIDTLDVQAVNEMYVSGKGNLGYDLFANRFTDIGSVLDINIRGDILRLLKSRIAYIKNARGFIEGRFEITTRDDGIVIADGNLSMRKGFMQLQDQVESIDDINLDFVFQDNKLKINKFSSQIGNGRLYIRNAIDQGDDNFYIGPLNLGYLLLRTNDAGIKVSIPDYLPANTSATAVLKGQEIREATIKGPFDDMEISGEIIVSNASIVYPPNTKNLLQLINLFQRKQEIKEQLPLPFTLNLLIRTANNVNYVTYPANLTASVNSFLRLVYDGSQWYAWNADFVSEKGTLDFYGTVFNVERVRLEINQANNVISVNGTFSKKAPDGTLVTLSVNTNPSKGPDIGTQLEFKLTSDNPHDKTTTQILSRLRYNKSMEELTSEQKQSLLQDEAMQLISTSVSTTYVSQFLSPIESKIRHFLGLDSFSITTGFVQNLFIEFANEGQQESPFANRTDINSDILQFSSSVFLNNLSISMGKYISSKLFLDYEIQFQESTDLSSQTQLQIYHNASMRINLPWNLRFIYTFSLKPQPEVNSHEIMLQRSFRF
jgi:hypothetical protein